ncbi:Sulfite exporter TauE/SafE [Roseovarius litorisediminis]|uniref:Probable membrane transporter protein n=1 Tax=Roseovarius litorisediminis TaxID=1312363 RepID=A0A1Y5R9F9_9RHOB|nr:sulfite exporter TauE/SafE family protein [Roseovarius litorisediminis]SLN11511.1 Sulfite exporter TauE/SafE [Roseovarius litorisediminis]
MGPDSILLIGAIHAVITKLYSSVGHSAASGYIAVMASYRFAKGGFIDWGSAVPILIASGPMAFIGGGIVLPDEVYRPLLGTLLTFAAAYLIWQTTRSSAVFSATTRGLSRFGGMASVAGIGFISGLSGIGDGSFSARFPDHGMGWRAANCWYSGRIYPGQFAGRVSGQLRCAQA